MPLPAQGCIAPESASKKREQWIHLKDAAGALISLAFVHNILRRHRACNVLLDHPHKDTESSSLASTDPYIDSEADPAKSRALESSLWEVKTLCNHYYIQVSSPN